MSRAKDKTSKTPDKARKRAEKLREVIEHHNRLYYVEAAPEISDPEFDALMKELEDLEAAYPDLQTPDSPTQRVGGEPLEGFETVEHTVPMLSIDNTYTYEDLRKFDERVRRGLGGEQPAYVVELKMDGVALSVRYEKGAYVQATTRGDGHRGDNVTANVKTIHRVPLKLKDKPPSVLEVRGEAFMTKKELERINTQREEEGLPPLANPRNTTAGTLKQLDPREVAKRRLDIFMYDLAPLEGVNLTTHQKTLADMESWGLPVNRHREVCKDIDAVVEACEKWDTKRAQLDYETDGMVVKVDKWEHRRRLGATSKAPRWVIAYKFPAQIAETKLEKISLQVGRSGAITPVAEMAPVTLAGTVVKRASLYNFEDLERKDLRVGDTIRVQKAGEIIPQVLEYVKNKRPKSAKPYKPPTKCPECGTELHKDPEGVFLRCLNVGCPAQVRERLEYYASRGAMDIEGLGPALVDQLVANELVKDPADLYTLEVDTVAELERMAKKSATNLINAIEESKKQPLHRLVNGLGIRHVGGHIAEVLAGEYGTMDRLMEAPVDDLREVHEIGDVVAESVHDFFETSENRKMIARLREYGVNMEETGAAAATGEGPLSGKTFVVTGTLSTYSRDEIHDRIKSLGGRASSSLSGKTDYLVAGEKAGSKLDKAKKLGVPVISEAEFEALAAGKA